MPDQILDPFHRALAGLISEEIEKREKDLAHGSASRVTEDVVSVAEKYAAAVSYISALEAVLELCHSIETNQNSLGPRPAQVKMVQR